MSRTFVSMCGTNFVKGTVFSFKNHYGENLSINFISLTYIAWKF